LDYCPAVDITFGEYLRAIITADRDLLPDDPQGRRVAFMEAFRHRGILPRDVRTISEETLSWSPMDLNSVGTVEPRSGKSRSEWLFSILENKELELDWDMETDRQRAFDSNAEKPLEDARGDSSIAREQRRVLPAVRAPARPTALTTTVEA